MAREDIIYKKRKSCVERVISIIKKAQCPFEFRHRCSSSKTVEVTQIEAKDCLRDLPFDSKGCRLGQDVRGLYT